MPSRCSDELFDATVLGDRQAPGDLYDRHAGVVRAAAPAIPREPADAEDVLQAVFIEAWREPQRDDSRRSSPMLWLTDVARRLAFSHLLRQQQALAPAHEASPDVLEPPELPPSCGSANA